LATDPELLAIWTTYTSGDISDLSESEYDQINYFLASVFGTYENAYFAYGYGVIGSTEWQRFEAGVCRHFGASTRIGYRPPFLTEEFWAYLENNCP
jgi:hypothetical protein